MSYRIERNVPVPRRAPRNGAGAVYPWAKMRPGDSFLIPAADRKALRSAAEAGRAYCRRHRPDLVCVSRMDERGGRVWLRKRPTRAKAGV